MCKRAGLADAVARSYIFHEDFTTDVAAAVASPHTCEPGPGTLTITGTDQSIASQRWVCPSNAATQGWYHSVQVARAEGTALVYTKVRVTSAPGGIGINIGFRNAASVGATLVGGVQIGTTSIFSNLNGGAGALAATLSNATDYDFAFVYRTTGSYILYKLSSATAWTLLYVEDCFTTSNMRAHQGYSSCPHQIGPVRCVQGFLIPRTYYSASGVIGTVDTGKADFVAKMRCTGTGTQALKFRIQDANNYWRIERAATTFRLYETVGGSDTQRATAAITAATGDRICVACEGTTIRLWHQIAAGTTMVTPTAYASASNFATSTSIAVTDEANYTELEVFPRLVYGVAA